MKGRFGSRSGRRSDARLLARLCLAIVVGLAVVPVVGGAGAIERAGAGVPTPTPTLPNIFPSSKPSPSPSPSKTPRRDDDDEREDDERKREGRPKKRGEKRDPVDHPRNRRRDRNRGLVVEPPLPGPRIPGAYDTSVLTAVAAQLRALGWEERKVLEAVYPPFIVAGQATWVDTWGADRFGPGPLLRRHEGQDVFCTLGDPVLAAEDGIVELGRGGLGGLFARLHRGDGSYWYYAHLSDFNSDEVQSGDAVAAGDVIGFCGTSGNASTTSPHVHFGWYGPEGPRNPMRPLVSWLEKAEAGALELIDETTGKRVRQMDSVRAERRFGDVFMPDRTTLDIPGASLWAAGSAPATGAFAVAQGALQEALARADDPTPTPSAPLDAGADAWGETAPRTMLSPGLARLLDLELWAWPAESAD